ncbi:MAG TPA: thioesterase domain-containing protein, partial [Ktedonobacteraceae bacterium]
MKSVSERLAALPQHKRQELLQQLKQRVVADENSPLARRPAALPGAWIMRYRPNEQARLRLFCFPYAGGRASIFRSWSEALPAEIELCCIQPP